VAQREKYTEKPGACALWYPFAFLYGRGKTSQGVRTRLNGRRNYFRIGQNLRPDTLLSDFGVEPGVQRP
jgi:hypothetical protein